MFKRLLTNPNIMLRAGKRGYQEMACASDHMSIHKAKSSLLLGGASVHQGSEEPGSKEYPDFHSELQEDKRPYLQLALRTHVGTEPGGIFFC